LITAAFFAFAPAGASAWTAAPTPRVLWGAYVAGGQYGREDAPWDLGTLARFTEVTGKRPSLVEWGQHWYECSSDCGMRPFRDDLMERMRRRGATPVLSWSTDREGGGLDQPQYRLRRIAAGDFDGFLRSWARGAKRGGHPLFLRMDWEMNTNSVVYSERANANRPGDFVRMWRHVHEVFDSVGADNVQWVWCPNVEYPESIRPLRSLYPGAAFVDWTCMDGYNWGAHPARPGSGWETPAQVFGPTYDRLAELAPDKPVMIGETASSEVGGSKAAWIRQFFNEDLPGRFARVRAVVWFDKHWDGMDWPLVTSPSASWAFRHAIGASRYLPGWPGRPPMVATP
jgi:Glycosyl hydrolase family 26